MDTPVIYEFSRNAWEQYRREEKLPVKGLPSLVANDDEVLSGVRKLVLALRHALASHKTSEQPQPRPVGQVAVAK